MGLAPSQGAVAGAVAGAAGRRGPELRGEEEEEVLAGSVGIGQHLVQVAREEGVPDKEAHQPHKDVALQGGEGEKEQEGV